MLATQNSAPVTVQTADLTPEQAAAEALQAGYDPEETWPGPQRLWKVRHIACGNTWETTVLQLRRGKKCSRCRRSPREARQAEWEAARIQRAEQAEAEARAAHFEPQVPYPGSQLGWEVVCADPEHPECRKVQYPRIGDIRRGRRCNHKPTAGQADAQK